LEESPVRGALFWPLALTTGHSKADRPEWQLCETGELKLTEAQDVNSRSIPSVFAVRLEESPKAPPGKTFLG